MARVQIKRIYDAPEKSDGVRVLVDRLWPRGVSKKEAALDLWMKELAPSTELRKWFNHDPERWAGFRQRYRRELRNHGEDLAALKGQLNRNSFLVIQTARADGD
jgi:uncharacterized protein YeaO (DUF488 family)